MKLISIFIISYFFIAVLFAAEFSVTPEQLTAEINIRKTKVIEFKQLHDYGQEHGIRIWVAGGSAAGLAHYVKDDLENEFLKSEGKEPIYFEGRFGYNYFDIFRSTQDCDIVIDGDEEQAQELESFIREKFAHLQGSKEVFEVRLLDKPRGRGAGEKDALLGNPDFLNQHTDSHSTGMVELTQPSVRESAVRDLFDWNNQKDSQFLLDVIENQLSYYFSDKHNTTKRFKEGINPPIISVLRYYTKLFQYGLKPRPADEKVLMKIIGTFDPKDPAWKESYVNKQINKNGVKMIRHAVEMEFAINTIERIGLKGKLLEFTAYGDEQVSWWVNKEPLRSFPVGRKAGKTAAQLGITIVAHETSDFLAYESITMSRRGVPNVFISRKNVEGENALHGDGFYAKIGKEGARGTRFTIRYTVDPKAVEGVDFIYIAEEDFVVVRNRNILKVIDESIELGPVDFFKLLSEQEIQNSDKGVWQKIALKIQGKMSALSQEEINQIVQIVKDELVKEKPKWYLIEEWYELEQSEKNPVLTPMEFFEFVETKNVSYHLKELIQKRMEVLFKTISKENLDQIVAMIQQYVEKRSFHYAVMEQWRDLVVLLVDSKKLPFGPVEYFKLLAEDESGDTYYRAWQTALDNRNVKVDFEMSKNELEQIEELVRSEIKKKKPRWEMLSRWFELEESGEHLDIFENLVKRKIFQKELISFVAPHPHWGREEAIVNFLKKVVERDKYDFYIVTNVLANPYWANHPLGGVLLETIIERANLAESILGGEILSYVLSKTWWADHPMADEFLSKLVAPADTYIDGQVVAEILSKSYWAEKPGTTDVLLEIIERNDTAILDDKLLEMPFWRANKRLRQLCDGDEPTLRAIRKGLESEVIQRERDCSSGLQLERGM